MKNLFDIAQVVKAKAKPRPVTVMLTRPQFSFEFRDNWTFSRRCSGAEGRVLPFDGQVFDADLDAFARHFQRPLSSLQVDLLVVAFAAYLADRFSPRRPCGRNASPYWRRSIRLSVPVLKHGHWLAVKNDLESLLSFLTEDDWHIDFTAGRQRTNFETQEWWRQKETPERCGFALFSGGLDSLAGLLNHIDMDERHWTLISGQTHIRMMALQQSCVAAVQKRFPHRVSWLPVEYGMKLKLDNSAMETTQRTRAFVHAVMGAVAAMSSRAEELFLFENGIGSFNLPVDYSQLGSQTSRGTHPTFLNRMSTLIEHLFESSFRITNPYIFITKGHMCATPSVRANADLVNLTFSCDRFPNYPRKEDQCGVCSSCLLRRVALHAADIGDPSSLYTIDITAHARLKRNADEMAFFKTSSQGLEMNSLLQSAEPWNALCVSYPWLRTSLSDASHHSKHECDEGAARIVSLYQTYWAEWQSFASLRAGCGAPTLSS